MNWRCGSPSGWRFMSSTRYSTIDALGNAVSRSTSGSTRPSTPARTGSASRRALALGQVRADVVGRRDHGLLRHQVDRRLHRRGPRVVLGPHAVELAGRRRRPGHVGDPRACHQPAGEHDRAPPWVRPAARPADHVVRPLDRRDHERGDHHGGVLVLDHRAYGPGRRSRWPASAAAPSAGRAGRQGHPRRAATTASCRTRMRSCCTASRTTRFGWRRIVRAMLRERPAVVPEEVLQVEGLVAVVEVRDDQLRGDQVPRHAEGERSPTGHPQVVAHGRRCDSC